MENFFSSYQALYRTIATTRCKTSVNEEIFTPEHSNQAKNQLSKRYMAELYKPILLVALDELPILCSNVELITCTVDEKTANYCGH